jgi:hypothetical protein
MRFNTLLISGLVSVLLMPGSAVLAAGDAGQEADGYRLEYIEREPGMDDYEVSFIVTDQYIRIDEADSDTGYIIYDDASKTIYSVSHHDKSTLVIEPYQYSVDDAPVKHVVEYLALADAPEVDGKHVYNYRVHVAGDEEQTCTELQLVEGLLPEVASMLKRYQQVVSGQQVELTDNVLNEIQTPCFFIDQVYNDGAYYDKGLPIQEWHSNERSRILATYKPVSVKPELFKVPEDYRQFTITRESRTMLE